jgi:hypothetical protein
MKYARRRICSSEGTGCLESVRDFDFVWRRGLVLFLAVVFRGALFLARAAKGNPLALVLPSAVLTPEEATLSFWTSLRFFGTR